MDNNELRKVPNPAKETEARLLKILLIEDNPGDARLIREWLREAALLQFQVTHADRLATGLQQLEQQTFDVLLLDLDLPDSRGFDTFLRVKREGPDLPLILLTGLDDAAFALRAVRQGAQDYLVKGQFDGLLLARAIRYSVERYRLRQDLVRKTSALLHSEARFHHMIEHNIDSMVIVDEAGRICFVNPAAERLFGRPADELLGTPFGFPLVTGESTEIEIAAGTEAGSIAFVEMELAETSWEGQPAFLASLRDITDRKEAAAQLRYQANILRNVSDAIVATDTDYVVESWNSGAEAVYGWSAEETIGRPLAELVRPQYPDESREQVLACFQETGFWRGETIHHRKDGAPIRILAAVSMIRDSAGQPVGAVTVNRDITERKRMEEALRLSQAEWQSTFDAMSDWVSLVDVESLRVLRTNRSGQEFVGLPASQIVGQKCCQLLHGTDEPIPDCPVQRMIRTGQQESVELFLPDKSQWLMVTADPVIAENGRIASVVHIVRDITDRKMAALALQEHSERLEEMVQARTRELERRLAELSALNAMAAVVNQSLDIEEIFNQALHGALHLIGVEAAALYLLNKGTGKLELKAHRGMPAEAIRRLKQLDIDEGITGRAIQTARPVIIDDLAHFPGLAGPLLERAGARSVVAIPLAGATGVIGAMGFATRKPDYFDQACVDLLFNLGRQLAIGIEKSQLFEALRKSEANLTQAQQIAHLGSWEWHVQRGEINWSAQIYHLYGLEADVKPSDDLVRQLIHPDDRAAFDQALAQAVTGSVPELPDYRLVKPPGEVRWFRPRMELFFNEAGQVNRIVGTVQDITEYKELQARLVRQEKLAVLGQMAGGVAHDLRNPIGVIKNALYYLQTALPEPEPGVQEALLMAERGIVTAERITGSLLDFARTRPPRRQPVDINHLLPATLANLPEPQTEIEVVWQLAESLPEIWADPDQLARIFGNLILNAIQAMSMPPEEMKGGRLTIKSDLPEPGWVAVSIADTGVGIPKEDRNKLFEPLFSGKAKGIGLGLALVKNLVEGHGGAIEVESDVGQGSTFTVWLPLHGGV